MSKVNALREEEIHKAAQRVGTSITGSCQNMDELIRSEPLLKDMDVHEATILVEQASEIFLCDGCGWWCENEEMHVVNDEQRCGDCKDD